jgi:uncharacterized protein with von Willebrand factor type A (vWA) domain
MDYLNASLDSLGGALKELGQYEFIDSGSPRQFQELMELIKDRLMRHTVRDFKEHIRGIGAEDMKGVEDLLCGLNEMLWSRSLGQEPALQTFLCLRFFERVGVWN